VGTVIFGIIPEKDKIIIVRETIIKLSPVCTGKDLFVSFFRFFDHARFQFIHTGPHKKNRRVLRNAAPATADLLHLFS
jgi:hypothetical protein